MKLPDVDCIIAVAVDMSFPFHRTVKSRINLSSWRKNRLDISSNYKPFIPRFPVIVLGQIRIVVVGVHHEIIPHRFHGGGAEHLLPLLLGLFQCGKQYAGQRGHDRHHNQKFHKREPWERAPSPASWNSCVHKGFLPLKFLVPGILANRPGRAAGH